MLKQQVPSLIVHQYASEAIEYIYTLLGEKSQGPGDSLTSSECKKARQDMLSAFYEQFKLVMEGAGKQVTNLKEFVESKPQLAEQVLSKVEITV